MIIDPHKIRASDKFSLAVHCRLQISLKSYGRDIMVLAVFVTDRIDRNSQRE